MWLNRSHKWPGVSRSAGAAIDDGAINAVREIIRRVAIVFRITFSACFERYMAEVLIEVQSLVAVKVKFLVQKSACEQHCRGRVYGCKLCSAITITELCS
jgi:hypothetical protein